MKLASQQSPTNSMPWRCATKIPGLPERLHRQLIRPPAPSSRNGEQPLRDKHADRRRCRDCDSNDRIEVMRMPAQRLSDRVLEATRRGEALFLFHRSEVSTYAVDGDSLALAPWRSHAKSEGQGAVNCRGFAAVDRSKPVMPSRACGTMCAVCVGPSATVAGTLSCPARRVVGRFMRRPCGPASDGSTATMARSPISRHRNWKETSRCFAGCLS